MKGRPFAMIIPAPISSVSVRLGIEQKLQGLRKGRNPSSLANYAPGDPE